MGWFVAGEIKRRDKQLRARCLYSERSRLQEIEVSARLLSTEGLGDIFGGLEDITHQKASVMRRLVSSFSVDISHSQPRVSPTALSE